MDPDRIEAALAGLGPESRALVELSVIREVADDDIASLLGTDESSVRSRREDSLAQLATALGADSAEDVGSLVREMRELPAVRWREGEEPEPADAAPEPHRTPEPPPQIVQPGAKRKRRLMPLLVGGVLVAAVALVLAFSGGEDGDGESPPPEEPASGQSSTGEPAKLEPVAGGSATGTAEIENGTLDLSISGLPDPGQDGYVVWLYNSLTDARPLNSAQSEQEFDLETKLPEGAEKLPLPRHLARAR